MLLQLGEFTIIAILDDSSAGWSVYQNHLQKITGPLTSLQARQVFSDLLSVNLNILKRPIFRSEFSDDGQYSITVRLPKKVSLNEERVNPQAADLLAFYTARLLPSDLPNREEILKEIAEGKRNYLWNENLEFINHRRK